MTLNAALSTNASMPVSHWVSHTAPGERARDRRAHAGARAPLLARVAAAASAVAVVRGWTVAHSPRGIGSRPAIRAGAATELALIAAVVVVVVAVGRRVRAPDRAPAF